MVCRSQADLNANKEVTAAMEAERRFLTKKYPSLASRLGTCYLRRQLHLLLLRHIRECLPNIAMKINVLKVFLIFLKNIFTIQGWAKNHLILAHP